MEENHESATDRLVRNTPWWAISIGLHLVVALALGLFLVSSASSEVDLPVVVQRPKSRPTPPDFQPRPDPATVPLDLPDANVDPMHVKTTQDLPEQTDDDVDLQSVRGENKEFVSLQPFHSNRSNDSIGAAGGPGGRKGGPGGGLVDWRRRGKGGTPPTQEAVRRALLWLARHQTPDGGWEVQGHVAQCRGEKCQPNPSSASSDFDTGVTGLALLAFLGAGYSHQSHDLVEGVRMGEVVLKGLQGLLARQDEEGCLGSRKAHKYMYNHCIAALALSEAFLLSGSKLFKTQAQRAVDFLVAAQNPGRAWRYIHRHGENDTSVTGWAVMVLKSAEMCGFAFPASAYEGVRSWLDEVTENSYYRVGYTQKNTGKVYCEHNQSFDPHEALTAIAVLSRIFMDKDSRDPRVTQGCAMFLRDLPRYEGAAIDYYYWYYASLALFQFDGYKDGDLWKTWNKALTGSLVQSQNGSGCKSGSWEPVDRWSCEGGRVYATALNTLTLEVYYRFASVFGTSR